jgi:cysteine-rich repeat protein
MNRNKRVSAALALLIGVAGGAQFAGCGDDDEAPPLEDMGTSDLGDRDLGPPDPDAGDRDTGAPDTDAGEEDGGTPPEDGGTPPEDGGTPPEDGAVADPCAGLAEGAPCTTLADVLSVCRAGACVASTCGDGIVDTRLSEECDDGNDVVADGCEPSTCRFSCRGPATPGGVDDCDDGELCNGAERCNVATHVCAAGTNATLGTACTLPADRTPGICDGAGSCVLAGCGNGIREGRELCDDGNRVSGDGCENDCTFTCSDDARCDDGDPCNGTETCMNAGTATSRCVAGTAPTCDDRDPCTIDSCTVGFGCRHILRDNDGDGFAPVVAGSECGTDCDDDNSRVFPGAAELCDGRDNDCDGMIDEEAPRWYLDCDGDGFAAFRALSVMACEPPAPMPSRTCAVGAYTSLQPRTTESADCFDANDLARPNQTMFQSMPAAGRPADVDFDYDCNGTEELEVPDARRPADDTAACVLRLGICGGARYWIDSTGILPRAPACGASGTLSSCVRNVRTGECSRVRTTAVQRCR